MANLKGVKKKTSYRTFKGKPIPLWAKLIGGKPNQYPKIFWPWLWREVLIGHYNESLSRKLPERNYSIYTNDRTIMSGKDKVAAIISLDGYGTSVPLDYKEVIRSRISSKVKVNFISFSSPTKIEWQSPEMLGRMRNYKRLDSEIGEVDVYDYQENIATLDRNSWLRDSIKYLANADTKRGAQMFDYYSHIVISGERGEDFDDSVDIVRDLLGKWGITSNRINRHIGKFLRSFSPVSQTLESKVQRSVGKNVLPDEIISRFVGYGQGKIGNSGICLGVDIHSGHPILKKFKKSDVDPENILILAETGWGKSYYVKYGVFQLAANRRVRVTIMDIEGMEYIPLAAFFSHQDDVVVLNMAEGTGAYFDPVAVATSGNEDLDRENNVYRLSRSYTVAMLRTLAGQDLLDMNSWVDTIIKECVALTYTDAGVTDDDYESWKNSRHLTLHDVYANIKRYHQIAHGRVPSEDVNEDLQERSTDPDYMKAINLLRVRTGQYFEKPEDGGLLSATFKERVSLDTVAKAKIVVCSFGMASRASSSVDPIQMALAQLSASSISHIRSLYCKSEGKFNLKIWEELQRWADFPGSEDILNVAVTGGRKMGDINFIVSNDPKMFIGTGSKLNIFANTTSFMIGAITDAAARETIANMLSIPELLPDLSTLVENAGDIETFNEDSDSGEESPYRRSFLIKLDKSVVTFGKVKIPEAISKSSLFRTGSIEGDQVVTVGEDTEGMDLELDDLTVESSFIPPTLLPPPEVEDKWSATGFLDGDNSTRDALLDFEDDLEDDLEDDDDTIDWD